MTHRYAEAALAEFIAAGRYYNRQVPGLGDEFVNEIEDAVRAVVAEPRIWRVSEEDVRRYLGERLKDKISGRAGAASSWAAA
jgi:toxin ParE1/3/4